MRATPPFWVCEAPLLLRRWGHGGRMANHGEAPSPTLYIDENKPRGEGWGYRSPEGGVLGIEGDDLVGFFGIARGDVIPPHVHRGGDVLLVPGPRRPGNAQQQEGKDQNMGDAAFRDKARSEAHTP